jgi:hypothetical protein
VAGLSFLKAAARAFNGVLSRGLSLPSQLSLRNTLIDPVMKGYLGLVALEAPTSIERFRQSPALRHSVRLEEHPPNGDLTLMTNIRCPGCGLINWATATECKKCRYLLQTEDTQDYSKPQHDPYLSLETQPLFSGVVIVLTIVLALGTVLLLLSRVLEIFDLNTTQGIGAIFVVIGLGLGFFAHLWMVVRIFEQSAAWGIASFFVPIIGLIAVSQFWEKTKRSFVGQLLCVGIVFTGYLISV